MNVYKKGFSFLTILIYSVLLIIGYELALNHFHGKSFEVFNYKVYITKCGVKFNDRIDTIEQKVKKK